MDSKNQLNQLTHQINAAAEALGYEAARQNQLQSLLSMNFETSNNQGSYLNSQQPQFRRESSPFMSYKQQFQRFKTSQEPLSDQFHQLREQLNSSEKGIPMNEEFIESNRDDIIKNYFLMQQQMKRIDRSHSNGNSLRVRSGSSENIQSLSQQFQVKSEEPNFNLSNSILFKSRENNHNSSENNQSNYSNSHNNNNNFSLNQNTNNLIQQIISQQALFSNSLQQQAPNSSQEISPFSYFSTSTNNNSSSSSQNSFQCTSQNQNFSTLSLKQSQIQEIERELAFLQQRLAVTNNKISQFSQSQTDLIGLGNFLRNREVIELLQGQLEKAWEEKKAILNVLGSLTSQKEKYQLEIYSSQFFQSHQISNQNLQIQIQFRQQQQQLLQKQQQQKQFQLQQHFQQQQNLLQESQVKPTQEQEVLLNLQSQLLEKNLSEIIASATELLQNEKQIEIKAGDDKILQNLQEEPQEEEKGSLKEENKVQSDQIDANDQINKEEVSLKEIPPSKIEEGEEVEIRQPSQSSLTDKVDQDIKESQSNNDTKDKEVNEQIDEEGKGDMNEQIQEDDGDKNEEGEEEEDPKDKKTKNKKADKRYEKLIQNVQDILGKEEGACSKIKPIALELCFKISKMNEVLKNRPYEAIAAAVIVHASRVVASPITVKNMSKITHCKEKIINRVFMFLKQNVEGFHNKMPSPQVFIANICCKMNFSTDISETANHLYQKSEEFGFVKGQHAATVAACIVKLSAFLHGNDMTVKQICEASNVCQISLRLLYRQIFPHRLQLLGDYKVPNMNTSGEIQSQFE